MHNSWKIEGDLGDDFILFVEGVIDLVINQIDIQFDQFIWYFLGVVIRNEFWDDLES